MNIGLIKWFNEDEGYGVLMATNPISELIKEYDYIPKNSDREVFLHISNWRGSKKPNISNVTLLVFETAFERNKITAKKCREFTNTKENWTYLISHLGSNEIIKITERYSTKEYNVISLALKSLPNNFDERYLKESLEVFFENTSNEELLIKSKTLLAVRSETHNLKLKKLLDDFIVKSFSCIDNDLKFDLWKKKLIPISAIAVSYLKEISELLTIENFRSIKKEVNNEHIIDSIISEILSKMKDEFVYKKYNSFDDIISIIDDDIFKSQVIDDLNIIGESNFTKSLYEELETIGKLDNDWDFRKIDEVKRNIPDFLSVELKEKSNQAIEYYIIDNSTAAGLVRACVKKHIAEPERVIMNCVSELTNESFNLLFNYKDLFKDGFIEELLEELYENKLNYELILTVALKYFSAEVFELYDKKIFEQSSEKVYFNCWSKGIGKIKPENYLLDYFDDDNNKFSEVERWIEYGYISSKEVKEILENKLESISNFEDRKEFQTVFNIIEYFISKDSSYIESISNKNNPFHLLILWYLGYLEEFNYDILKGKFIYFKPHQQVRIIKKLFQLKKLGNFDLTIKKLDELVRADIDLFLTNEKFNPDIVLDLSTSVIIEAIKKYKEEGKFLVETDLLTIVLKEIGLDKTKRFQLSDYFDECEGRMIGKYNWKTNGSIKKESFGNNQFYFKIDFEYNSNLVDAVKRIPGRKYNHQERHWGVPSRYLNDVRKFAEDYRFFLDFEGSNYANNPHLAEYFRSEKPNNINFCEGAKVQDIHRTYKKEFWWCSNQECFKNVQNLHSIEEWEKFTLLDFLNILGLSVIEKGNYGTFENGKYNQFISHINRFNQLLEKIYCKECNHILYPVESSNYAAYSVTRFCCENESCGEYKNTVYLNHCLNGKCNSIIDSRDSKKCPNDLYICQVCGSCCSHSMFIRRLNNLEKTGGFIHPDLSLKIENRAGHLERAEYYCHSCGEMMNETTTDTFVCYDCNVIYETEQYRFSREHKSLRRKDYPTT